MSKKEEKATPADSAENVPAVKEQNANALADVGYGDYGRVGFEDMSSEDLSIPFLNLLQSNSSLVEDEEAKAGQLFNKVTGEVIDGDKGIVFVPCYKQHLFVEWVPIDAGGGFVGMHEPSSEVVQKAIADNGGKRYGDIKVGDNDLVETHYVYGLILNEEGTESIGFAVVPFASTKIPVVRDWFTVMYTMKGQIPLFAHRARIKTVKQKNKSGTFYNFKVEAFADSWKTSLIEKENKELLDEGNNFMKMVKAGEAKADHDSAAGGTGGEEKGKPTPF